MTTSETIDRWAGQPSGWNWVDGRDYVSVQSMALKYAEDQRRHAHGNSLRFQEWEASAKRFIDAVVTSDRWCLDPDEAGELDVIFDSAFSENGRVNDLERLFAEQRSKRRKSA